MMNSNPLPYEKYTQLVPETDLLPAMREQLQEMLVTYGKIPADQELTLHAPYTWNARQVLGHIIDAERVFGYRAMRFSRNDSTPLPGFDENTYVQFGGFEKRPIIELLREFEALRTAHLHMFAAIPVSSYEKGGTAANLPFTVGLFAKLIVGHARHHTQIIKSRFGI